MPAAAAWRTAGGPDVRRHATGPGSYTHYSTLRTIEDAFGLPHLGRAADAASLGPMFKTTPRIPRGA